MEANWSIMIHRVMRQIHMGSRMCDKELSIAGLMVSFEGCKGSRPLDIGSAGLDEVEM